MRRLVMGVVLILLSCVVTAAQDATVPPLERLIDIDYSLRLPVHECTVPGAVAGLARRFHFPAGVEYLPVDCQVHWRQTARNGESVNLRGLTIGEALRKLSALDPRYRLIIDDGVMVIRPVTAWADSKNILNRTADSFALEDATLGGALDAVVSAITGEARTMGALLGQRTEQGARVFSVKTGSTSAGGALAAIVRAHGDSWWEVREGAIGRIVSFYTFDGGGIGASHKALR